MGRFQSKEEYAQWRATQRGGQAPPPMTDTEAPPAEQVYDGPAPGSQEFQGRRLQTAGLASEREKSQAMLCHLLAFAGFFVPFGNIIGPLIVWKANKANSDFVDAHGKASLNFQISLTLFAILGALGADHRLVQPDPVPLLPDRSALRRGDDHRQQRESPQRRGRRLRLQHALPEVIDGHGFALHRRSRAR